MGETPKELANLAGIGKLSVEPCTPGEITGLLTSGSERLADARNEGLALSSRFDLAYNAAHSFSLAKAHAVRNAGEYEGHFDADTTLLRNLIDAAETVRVAVAALPALPRS